MGRLTAILALATSLAAVAPGSGEHPGEQFTELLGFRLLQAKLADVQRRLGSVELSETGEAGEYLASLCYTDRRAHTTVLFKSGEMGGPDHELLGFELRRHADPTDSKCRPIESSAGAVHSLQLGPLHLGMTRDAYAQALGELQELSGRGTGRVFERRQPMTQEELARCPQCAPYPFWDVVIEVFGEFRNGVLVRLSVWKTVTS
jgi:hypothetical protein